MRPDSGLAFVVPESVHRTSTFSGHHA